MKLSRLLEGLPSVERINWRDVEISGLAIDSRSVAAGDLFIAVGGHSADGHSFTPQAVAAGAAALVVEKPVEADVPVIVVESSSTAVALLARIFFSDPSANLVLCGITGTNGKTSTAFILRAILAQALGPAGIIGTVGYGAGDELRESAHTTPSAIELNAILALFVRQGCRGAVMEVSSHAAAQGRIGGLEFDVGVFTNVTRDHLDYHGSFEDYVAAKESFVTTLCAADRKKKPGTLVCNIDDPSVAAVGARFPGRVVYFGRAAGAQIRCLDLRADLTGTSLRIAGPGWEIPVSLALLGSFSAWNALAAAAAAWAVGIGPRDIRAGLEAVRAIPGRFQLVAAPGAPTVIVDYAHTPDALEKLLLFCRELGAGRLVTVFGCGGDRDRGKRPIMGRIAAELSDLVYVTSDNPRSEDPDAIIRDILVGTAGCGTPLEAVPDRREAIHRAVAAARPGDLVVIAGKGHEECQIHAEGITPFSDAREARSALAGMEDCNQS